MKKLVSLFALTLTILSNTFAQSVPKYFAVETFPKSAKVSPAEKIFDECYIIGYNKKGQLLYGYNSESEAADYNGYSIILFDTKTKLEKILLNVDIDDSLNTYETFAQYFTKNKKAIAQLIKKYSIENKLPTITLIAKKDYTISQKCKAEYEWFNCTFKISYKNEKPFTVVSNHIPDKKSIPTLYKLLSFDNHKIVLYYTIQRGWEGHPYVVGFGVQ